VVMALWPLVVKNETKSADTPPDKAPTLETLTLKRDFSFPKREMSGQRAPQEEGRFREGAGLGKKTRWATRKRARESK